MSDYRTSSPLPGDRLELLCRLSREFSSSLDLGEVLYRVMDEVIAAVHAERGFIMLHDEAGGLVFRVARGMDQATIEAPQFEISRGVVEEVARDSRAVLTGNAQRDPRFNMRESVNLLSLRSILCVPLVTRHRKLGAIYVENRLQAGVFTEADLDLLSSLAASAAIAIENANLYLMAVEKGRLERELQMAHDIQAGLLPRRTPQVPGWEFAVHWQPARQVAGDFYDFIEMDGGLGLVIADVSGKGVPAALFMAVSRSIVRGSVGRSPRPAECIAHANRLICVDSSGGMFVTLFFGCLDPAAHTLTYVNAGHNPPLLYQAARNVLTELSRTAMALGVYEDAPLEQEQIRLEPGDRLVLYTDGVTDAMDSQDNPFGAQRFRELILENRAASATEIVDRVTQSIRSFAGDGEPFDDIAIVVVSCLK
ncbi:MAG: SpoIIE family protein phosphatase [Anaerolineae bacterium]|nr:SpoIIE family protein phosphatase [Anaerolineae bacterium]